MMCALISVFYMGSLWIFVSFAPLVLTKIGHMPLQKMGLVMSAFGIGAIVWQFALPLVSDYMGRKKTLFVFLLFNLIPLLLLYFFHTGWVPIFAIVALGGPIVTLNAFIISIIPVETVPSNLAATAGALVQGVGEFVGAFMVGIAGALANTYGLTTVLLIAAGAAFIAALLALGLTETSARNIKSTLDEQDLSINSVKN